MREERAHRFLENPKEARLTTLMTLVIKDCKVKVLHVSRSSVYP
jgi:hypothetical protein